VQIVKGWVDATGQSHEKVFDVAGDAANGASVDTSTCTPSGAGFDSLCAVWDDPEFDPSQRAFYYARVLENPTCRWSTYHCNNQGIDCSNPASVPAEYAECCNAAVPKTIQERAWSSPIWYRPEGIARLRGKLAFGQQPQRDFLQLEVRLGAVPPGLDLTTQDLTVALHDDDEVYRVTIPAGTLRQIRPGRFVWNDAGGSVGGLRSVLFESRGNGQAVLKLRTVRRAFPAADRVDHFIELSLQAGTFEITTSPLWQFTGTRLATRS
jgi:hypothetical protein